MATGASTVSERQAYECPICANYFVRPKLLWCGHTVCKPCLRTWAHISAVCPLCKANVRQSRSQPVAMDALVDALPDDVAMATLVEAARLLGQERGECEECGEGGEYLCPDCRHVLCVTCRDVHNDPDVSRQHVLVELSEATAESLVAQLRARCASHQHRVADLFCPAHNEALCPACASDRHGECPDVEAFHQHADRLADQLGDLKDRLTRAVDELRWETQVLAEQLEKAAVEREKALSVVGDTCDDLIRQIETTREYSSQTIVRAHDQVKNDLEDKKRSTDRLLSSLCAHVGVTERFQLTSPSDLSDAMAAIRTRVECLCQEKEELTPKYMTTVVKDTDALGEIQSQMRSLFTDELAPLRPEAGAPFASGDAQASPDPMDFITSVALTLDAFRLRIGDALCRIGEKIKAKRTDRTSFCRLDRVLLSDGGRTAEWERGGVTLAMVDTAVTPGDKCEVRLDSRNTRQDGICVCGVTTRPPSSLGEDAWPELYDDKDRRLVFLSTLATHRNDRECRALKGLPEGSRLGLSTTGTTVHLYVDGGEVAEAPYDGSPCYAFFGLSFCFNKITLLT